MFFLLSDLYIFQITFCDTLLKSVIEVMNNSFLWDDVAKMDKKLRTIKKVTVILLRQLTTYCLFFL